MTFHPSLSLPFPPPPITINIMLFRMAIQSQLSWSSQPLTPQLTSPSSTLTPLSLFPPAQAPDLNPPPAKDERGFPASDQDDSGIHHQSMDPDEALLRCALHQVFETDRNVAQLSSQGHTLMKVLAELQTLPTRIVSEFALLNARVDQRQRQCRLLKAPCARSGPLPFGTSSICPVSKDTLSGANYAPNTVTPGKSAPYVPRP